MSIWQLTEIYLVYPTISKDINDFDLKYFAISTIYFNYKKYQLQLQFENSKSFNLFQFVDDKKVFICEGDISKIHDLLEKFNLPIFVFDIKNINSVKYCISENDKNKNYDSETNIYLIKSGDYGFPINYKSKYLVDNYEYCNHKKEIEKLILEIIEQNLTEIFNT